ncbi:MAG: hypothetical protein U9O98_04190 [Asgard group archaeon]|nr:hypothetical protein [Asgard group archaeon]
MYYYLKNGGLPITADVYSGKSRRAFIIKVSGSVDAYLRENDIMLGWSKAEGLLDESLTRDEFREIVHQQYFSKDDNYRRSGQIAGDLWRFIREMNIGNYVLVPTEGGYYIGQIVGPARYEEMRIYNDTAYRRKVKWLNGKNPVPMEKTTDEIKKKLRSPKVVIDASEILQEIEFSLRIS